MDISFGVPRLRGLQLFDRFSDRLKAELQTGFRLEFGVYAVFLFACDF